MAQGGGRGRVCLRNALRRVALLGRRGHAWLAGRGHECIGQSPGLRRADDHCTAERLRDELGGMPAVSLPRPTT